MKNNQICLLVTLGLIFSATSFAQMRIPDLQGVTKPATTSGYGGSTYGKAPGSGSGPVGGTSVQNVATLARKMQERVHNRVKPPLAGSGKFVIVATTVGKNGQVLNAKIKKSSGNPTLDAAALATVKSSAPFAPLPADFGGKSMNVDLSLP